jgi:hypothetical protein
VKECKIFVGTSGNRALITWDEDPKTLRVAAAVKWDQKPTERDMQECDLRARTAFNDSRTRVVDVSSSPINDPAERRRAMDQFLKTGDVSEWLKGPR